MVRTRKTSNLGADIRGDTSAPAMSTMNEVSPIDGEPPKWDKVGSLRSLCTIPLRSFCSLFSSGSPSYHRQIVKVAPEASQKPLLHSPFQGQMLEAHMASPPPDLSRPSRSICR
jgi:hypothetical protein